MRRAPYAYGWKNSNACIRLGASRRPAIRRFQAMLRPRHLACAVALALASSAAFAQSAPPVQASSHAGLFDNMVVFGDSLSDDGNLSLVAQLPFIARFTTNPGQTGVENVADYFGVPMTPALAGGTDFAFGGAGVINN